MPATNEIAGEHQHIDFGSNPHAYNLTDAQNEPIDIFATLTPRPNLTRDMLPDVIAEFAFDEAERLGIEPAAVAMPSLNACAAAIDDGIEIQPKVHDTRWTESARLWLALVGDPGAGKTPSINKAVEPCRHIEDEWRGRRETVQAIRATDGGLQGEES